MAPSKLQSSPRGTLNHSIILSYLILRMSASLCRPTAPTEDGRASYRQFLKCNKMYTDAPIYQSSSISITRILLSESYVHIYRWAALVSCSCIRSLEFSAIGHSVITFFNCFPPPAEDISVSQIIPSHSIVSPYTPSWSQ